MDLGLKGKNALVSGASRGIGRGIAEELASEGVNLYLLARSEAVLAEYANFLKGKYGIKVHYLAVDFADPKAINNILRGVSKHFDAIDILVNVSGGPRIVSALESEGAEYKEEFNSMIKPFIDLSRFIAMSMMKRQWGRIIYVASSGVIQPINDLCLSNTLRSAMVSWNKTFSNEIAHFGVTVNTLIPGRINTERVQEIDAMRANKTGKKIKEIISESANNIPAKRYGTIKEIASTAVFLASQQAGYITGSCIRVDGGMIRSIF